MGMRIDLAAVCIQHFPIAAFFTGDEQNNRVRLCKPLDIFRPVGNLTTNSIVALKRNTGVHPLAYFSYNFLEPNKRFGRLGV